MSKSQQDATEQRMLEGLDDVRAQVDEVDQRIVTALVERERLVMEVARRKAQKGDGKVRDPVREEALLARLAHQGQGAGLDGFYVTRVFRELIDHSVRLQQEFLAKNQNPGRVSAELVVAYQGVDGAYSHLAAMRHFGPRGGEVVFRGYPSFRAMMEAVRDGQAHYGVLPIENTTAGSINDAYDLLAQMDLSVVGEEIQKVEHCLVALEAIPVNRIRRVFSHPQALAQCSNFLGSLTDCHVEAYIDTALSVQRVGREQDLSQAAIASEEAARRYGLVVIKRDIANQKENFTRMMIIAATPEKVDARVAAKTSLILATKHEQGALLSCLDSLASRGCNLTKIESRPRPHTPWEYLFYLDFEGNIDDPSVAEALEELREKTSYLRLLGCYPGRTMRESRPPEAKSFRQPEPRASRPSLDANDLDPSRTRLSSRHRRPEDTVIEVGGVRLGGASATVVARVNSYASREGLLDLARAVRAAGAGVLWAPCFQQSARDVAEKLGADPLTLLEEVGRIAGIPVMVEVLHPSDVDRAVLRADFLVVGGANMENPALLREVGRVDRPVMLERGAMASVEEWLSAADYVLERGNHRVFLCERGIRTFERGTLGTLDLSAVALLRERSHLPVAVDACQATSSARLAALLSESALAVGAQAFVLEVQAQPSGPKDTALGVDDLAKLVTRLSGT
ncbi:MAG: prephenate dehydratase [Myxococcales bacterium]